MIKKLVIILSVLYLFSVPAAQPALADADSAYNELIKEGVMCLTDKDAVKAELAFRQAISLLPDNPDAYINLAVIYMNENNYQEAIGTLKQALSLMPANSPNKKIALTNLGLCYFNTGEYELSRQSYSQALELDRSFSQAARGLKQTVAKGGLMPLETKPPAQEVNTMDENKSKAQQLLKEGSDAFKNNDAPAAISLLEQSIKLDPRFAEPYYRLGVIYIYEKNADKAVECFKKTLEIDPNFTRAYTNLGSIFGQLKRYPQALAFYEKALSLDNQNPKIQYNIGLIYLATGKKDAAKPYFAVAKELAAAQKNTRLLKEIEKVYKQ